MMNHHNANSNPATKAVILARVSSKDQEDNYSLPAQKRRLMEYCQRKGLEVVEVFEIVESSTAGDRRKFHAAIKLIKKHKGKIALVVDKVDRLQRSFKEVPLLDELVRKDKLELHFNSEGYCIHANSNANDRTMWNMQVMMAQNYADTLRDNARRSISQKIHNGEWISQAPIGYINHRLEERKSTVILDDTRAMLMRKLFETYATGNYSIPQLVGLTKEWGLTNSRGKQGYLSRTHIYEILNNPFYYGVMRIKKTGAMHPHIYPTIISKQLYDQCQLVMKGKNKKAYAYRGHDHVFRGLVKCGVTGRTICTDTKRKRYQNGDEGKWNYLVATNPDDKAKKVWVKEEDILSQVEAVFASLQIGDALKQDVITYIRKTSEVEKDFHGRQIDELHKEQKRTQGKLDKLIDLLMDEAISKEDHVRKSNQLRKKQADIREQIATLEQTDEAFKENLIRLLNIANNSYRAFKDSSIEQKHKLINFVFSNLTLNGKSLCYTLRKPFDGFAECTKIEEWRALQDSNL